MAATQAFDIFEIDDNESLGEGQVISHGNVRLIIAGVVGCPVEWCEMKLVRVFQVGELRSVNAEDGTASHTLKPGGSWLSQEVWDLL
jgi:hypothetical protein